MIKRPPPRKNNQSPLKTTKQTWVASSIDFVIHIFLLISSSYKKQIKKTPIEIRFKMHET